MPLPSLCHCQWELPTPQPSTCWAQSPTQILLQAPHTIISEPNSQALYTKVKHQWIPSTPTTLLFPQPRSFELNPKHLTTNTLLTTKPKQQEHHPILTIPRPLFSHDWFHRASGLWERRRSLVLRRCPERLGGRSPGGCPDRGSSLRKNTPRWLELLSLCSCFLFCSIVSVPKFIVRSPFRAKHYVVMQYMAAGPKCPLPPPPWIDPYPSPLLPPLDPTTARPPPKKTAWLVEDREDQEELMNKEELTTLPTRQGLRTAVALSTASCYGIGCSALISVVLAMTQNVLFVKNFSLKAAGA